MQHWLGVWDGGAGFARVRAAWLERAGPVGEICTVNTGTEQIAGAFRRIDAERFNAAARSTGAAARSHFR